MILGNKQSPLIPLKLKILQSRLPPPPFLGGRITANPSQGFGGEAGDFKDEANGGQGQAEGAGETQDPAGAASGVEDQNARAAE